MSKITRSVNDRPNNRASRLNGVLLLLLFAMALIFIRFLFIKKLFLKDKT